MLRPIRIGTTYDSQPNTFLLIDFDDTGRLTWLNERHKNHDFRSKNLLRLLWATEMCPGHVDEDKRPFIMEIRIP